MNPTSQSQRETLGNIRSTLERLQSNIATKPPSQEVASGISDVLKGTSNYLSTLSVNNGVLTSSSARNAVDSGKDTLNRNGVSSSASAMAQLMEANARLTKKFEQEKATRESLEADVSIADKRAEKAGEAAAAAATAKGKRDATTGMGADGTKTGTETPEDQPTVDEGVQPLEGMEADPVATALAKAANESIALTNNRLAELSALVDAEDEDTKRSIRNAESLARIQTERIKKENARLEQAARVAGIVSGRGMYSPYEHEGIISEVVQEGLARVQEIEFTKQETILTAKKALRDFKYKSFTEATDMIESLSELKRNTIIEMNRRLVEVEQQQRERIKFDNEQADRAAILIAPDLMNASAEELAAAAAANNIELGALVRAVQDYKYEQESRALDLTSKRESIAASRDARRRANEKTVEVEKPMSFSDLNAASERYGLFVETGSGDNKRVQNLIPPSWTRTDLEAFIVDNPDVSEMASWEKKKVIQDFQNGGTQKAQGVNVAEMTNSSINLLRPKQ